jgi:hypothetical protein
MSGTPHTPFLFLGGDNKAKCEAFVLFGVVAKESKINI